MLVELFFEIDEFCQKYKNGITNMFDQLNISIGSNQSQLCLSEIMTILVYYHQSSYKNFKSYYQKHVMLDLKNDFPHLVSYNRFVELTPRCCWVLFAFMKYQMIHSSKSGIYFIDSSKLIACHPKRKHQHKVMMGLASWGKTSTGWFFGIKYHLIINQFGQLMDVVLSSGNVADNNVNILAQLTGQISGWVFGDRGYLINEEKKWFVEQDGRIIWSAKQRRNAKTKEDLPHLAKLWRAKRGLIESVINIHKTDCNIEHTRHRSPINAITNIFAALCAYNFKERKPSAQIDVKDYYLEQGKEYIMMAA